MSWRPRETAAGYDRRAIWAKAQNCWMGSYRIRRVMAKVVKNCNFQCSRPMNAETAINSGVKQAKPVINAVSEKIWKDCESYPGAFRLKNFSMQNNQGTCWIIPRLPKSRRKKTDDSRDGLKMVTWSGGVWMTMQDNGKSPNERTLLISSTPILGTVNCTAQDRYKLSKGCTEAAKTAERTGCDGKNGALWVW